MNAKIFDQQRCLIQDATKTIRQDQEQKIKIGGGRPRQSYLSTLLRDVGINTKEEL